MKLQQARPLQQGMALIAALFLIVVLAGLGIFAVRIGNSQQQAINLALLNSRALAAANSGLEFGANRALVNNICVTPPTDIPLTQMALSGFTVRVSCSRSAPNINGTIYQVYQLQARAQRGAFGSPDYVYRYASKTVTNY